MRTTFALAALAGTLAAAPASAEAPLSGEEIRSLVSGRSAQWVRGDGSYSGSITYHTDGRLSSRVTVMGAAMEVSGTWSIEGDRFCRTIKLDPRPSRCQSVVRSSGKTYRFLESDGSLATTTTFQ